MKSLQMQGGSQRWMADPWRQPKNKTGLSIIDSAIYLRCPQDDAEKNTSKETSCEKPKEASERTKEAMDAEQAAPSNEVDLLQNEKKKLNDPNLNLLGHKVDSNK